MTSAVKWLLGIAALGGAAYLYNRPDEGKRSDRRTFRGDGVDKDEDVQVEEFGEWDVPPLTEDELAEMEAWEVAGGAPTPGPG